MAYPGNPNWPLLLAELGMQANPYFSTSTPFYTDLTARQYGQIGTRRGSVFELGKPQSGELHGQWMNKDGLLDPGNATGAYAGQLLLFRPYRVRAQWPPTSNRLTADQATGGEGTPIAPGLLAANNSMGITWTGPSASGGISIVTSGTAFQGTQVFQNTMASTATVFDWAFAFYLSVAPGVAYSFSSYIRCLTVGQSPTVSITANWYTGAGTYISTVSGTTAVLTGGAAPSWTQITLSATAPSNAAYVLIGPELASNMSVNTIFQADGLQFEQAAAVTTFTVPNTWQGIYGGMVERYPQKWNYGGTYGLVSPICTDSMGPLSQLILPDQLLLNLKSPLGGAAPVFQYNLDEASNSVTFKDAMGNRPVATVVDAIFGAGKVAPGASITSATPGGAFLSANGRSVTNLQGTGLSPAGPQANAMSGIAIPGAPGVGLLGPGGGTGRNFTRMIAFRSTQQDNGLTSPRAIWSSGYYPTGGVANGNCIAVLLQGTTIQLILYGNTNQQSAGPYPGNVSNGDWHLLLFGIDNSGLNVTVSFDGLTTVSGSLPALDFTNGFSSDVIGMCANLTATSGATNYTNNFNGDVAYMVEWPYAFTAAQYTQVYKAWRDLFSGESSGARYQRILSLANYQGPVNLDTGSTTAMGPCDVFGQDVLTALQDVVDTESGSHFVDGSGVLRFQARSRRYNAPTIKWTFGDANPLGSEIPYSSIAFDDDATYLSNESKITHHASGAVFQVDDATSQANYGIRSVTRTINTQATQECQDAANYFVQRYKDPHTRMQSVQLNVSANPSLMFPVALGMELGDRVQVNRRPPLAPAITLNGFIDQISHQYDEKGGWFSDVQISPLDSLAYGVFASMHTTLHTTISSGVGTITIDALPDAAANVLRANLTGGQQLTLDPGLATQETVTIATGGVPVTALNYTTAVLTLTANTTQAHTAGGVVCEVLPAGITSATTWDTLGVYDTSHYAY